MALADESCEVLMQRVQRYHRDAMTVLVRRHADMLLTFLRRMGLRPQLVDEAFQEVFLIVWDKRSRFQTHRAFRPWLMGIAANVARRTLRNQWPVATTEELSEAARSRAPIEKMIHEENAHLVAAGLDSLPTAQRQVVVMRVWNGLSYREIATALSISESSARTHMSLALKALRNYLEPRIHFSD